MIRALRLFAFAMLAISAARADGPAFQKIIKSRLIFEASRDNPRLLEVYLHLDNTRSIDLRWTANWIAAIQPTLLDQSGKPVRLVTPVLLDMLSNYQTFALPGWSRMDWRLTYRDGMNLPAPKADEYQIQLGDGAWYVPKATVGDYSLGVQLRGWNGLPPDPKRPSYPAMKQVVLFDVPPQKIVVTPRAAE